MALPNLCLFVIVTVMLTLNSSTRGKRCVCGGGRRAVVSLFCKFLLTQQILSFFFVLWGVGGNVSVFLLIIEAMNAYCEKKNQ